MQILYQIFDNQIIIFKYNEYNIPSSSTACDSNFLSGFRHFFCRITDVHRKFSRFTPEKCRCSNIIQKSNSYLYSDRENPVGTG